MNHGGPDFEQTASLVIQCWSKALGEPVTLADDVLAMGAHSLMGSQVCGELMDELGVDVPISLMFSTENLTEYAEGVHALRAERLVADQ